MFDTSDFGEPTTFPGGINFGTITVDPATGQISQTTSLSTIEVVNILLGSGNDRLTITGTLLPGPDRSTGIVADHGGLTVVHGGGNSLVSLEGRLQRRRHERHPHRRHRLGETPGSSSGSRSRSTGIPGLWTIAAISGATLTLTGAAFAPATVTGVVAARDPKTGADADRRRHDHRHRRRRPGLAARRLRRHVQDGVWYGGHPRDVSAIEFGEKPFDPFPNLPDENEDDEWVFPLADPFDFAGNDVIDAQRAVRGRRRRRAADRRLHRLRRRRRRPDHRQPGRRPPRRRLGRRHDPRPARRRPHLRRQRRQREHPHARADDPDRRRQPDADLDRLDAATRPARPARCRRICGDVVAGDGSRGTAPAAGDLRRHRSSATTARSSRTSPTRTCPSPLLQKIQTTTLRLAARDRVAQTCRTATTTSSSATSAATSSSAAPATTWPTATRPTTWSSATTSS